jgi:hypothetical protein
MFRNPLARDVTVVLVIKTLIVIAAALFVFGPSQRPNIDAASVRTLFASSPVTGEGTP